MSSWASSSFIAIAASDGPEPVVQVPADPAALLLARRDEALAGALELAVERDGLDERADLAADVLEQAPVARTERVARRGRPPAGARRAAAPPADRSTAVC